MITVKEVEKLAELSRITLTPEEKEKMAAEIGSIIGYIDQIKEVSAATVEDSKNRARETENVMREDLVKNQPHEYTERILANAPARKDDYIEVKKILS